MLKTKELGICGNVQDGCQVCNRWEPGNLGTLEALRTGAHVSLASWASGSCKWASCLSVPSPEWFISWALTPRPRCIWTANSSREAVKHALTTALSVTSEISR